MHVTVVNRFVGRASCSHAHTVVPGTGTCEHVIMDKYTYFGNFPELADINTLDLMGPVLLLAPLNQDCFYKPPIVATHYLYALAIM